MQLLQIQSISSVCPIDTTRWFRYKCTFNHKDLKARTTFHRQERNSSEIKRKVAVLLTCLVSTSYSILYAIFLILFIIEEKMQGRTWEKNIKSFDCGKKTVVNWLCLVQCGVYDLNQIVMVKLLQQFHERDFLSLMNTQPSKSDLPPEQKFLSNTLHSK